MLRGLNRPGRRPLPWAAPALMALLAAALLLTACGGSAPEVVAVTLREWEITLSRQEIPTGRVRFEVRNGGTLQHQLKLIKSDAPPNELPLLAGRVDENKVNVVHTGRALSPGGTEVIEHALSGGKYLLICNLVTPGPGGGPASHYQQGMTVALIAGK